MNQHSAEKTGGLALIAGSLLLTAYAALFPTLLPLGNGAYDFVKVVQSPAWVPLAITSFAGVILMMIGFYTVYSRIRDKAGWVGTAGFLFVEVAYLLQACKVTWELFLYPVIANHSASAFLLRDAIIKHDPTVVIFRITASVTILIGIVLFCLAIYRSRAFPKLASVLVFAGALVYAIGPLFSIFISVAGILTFAVGCLLIALPLIFTRA